MTRLGELSLSIIIWRIGGGGQLSFALGPNNSLGGPAGTHVKYIFCRYCVSFRIFLSDHPYLFSSLQPNMRITVQHLEAVLLRF